MSDAADEILEGGIRDARSALLIIEGSNAQWQLFAAACTSQQFDLATMYGERLVASIEAAVDLYQASHKRMAQFVKITEGLE